MTPQDALARQWRALLRAGMLTSASLQSGAGPAVLADVILDRPDVDAFDDVVVSAHRIRYRLSDWPAAREGDQVQVGAQTYVVRRQAATGDGLLGELDLKHN